MFALTAYTPGFTADNSRFTGTVNLQICLSLYQFSGKNKQISEKGKNIFVCRAIKKNHISNLHYYELC